MKLFDISLLLLAVGLSGCATYQPVPPGYAGSTAMLSDSSVSEGLTKAQLFVAMEIDGNAIRNGIGETAGASYGRGFKIMATPVERAIPARPMKVKLKGTHATGAPIHALISHAIGTFYSVEGVVDFSPEANKRYFVWGELKEHGSTIWISEEGHEGQPVTEKVIGK